MQQTQKHLKSKNNPESRQILKFKYYFAAFFILLVIFSAGFSACSIKEGSGFSSEAVEENTATDSEKEIKDEAEPGEGAEVKEGFIRYYNEQAGFYLDYPEKSFVFSTNPYENIPIGKLMLYVKTEKTDDAEREKMLGYDRQAALRDEEELSKGNFGKESDTVYMPSSKVIKINSNYAKEFIVFGRYDLCDVVFERVLVFYNNGYRIMIGLSCPKENIIKEAPDFFYKDPENCSNNALVWKRTGQEAVGQNNFYRSLTENKSSGTAGSWYSSFEEIKDSIIINSKNEIKEMQGTAFKSIYENKKDSIKNILKISSRPEFFGLYDSEALVFLNETLFAASESKFKEFEDKIKISESKEADIFSGNIYIEDFTIYEISENIASFYFTNYTFSGGVYGNTEIIALNYDLKSKKEMKLAEIFKQDFDYLKFLSDYCIKDLGEQIKSRQEETDEELLQKGAGPVEENFSNFLISEKSLIIKFSEYQIGEYVSGIFDVLIPFEEFEKNINEETAVFN